MSGTKKHIIRLESLEKQAFFKAPEGYFETLPDLISQKIALQHPLLSAVFKKQVFLVPEAYFEQLPQQIKDRIAGKALSSLPQLHQSVFNTPENYFDALPGAIQSRIQQNRPSRSYLPTLGLQPAWRYALAACSLAVLGLMAWWLISAKSKTEPVLAGSKPQIVKPQPHQTAESEKISAEDKSSLQAKSVQRLSDTVLPKMILPAPELKTETNLVVQQNSVPKDSTSDYHYSALDAQGLIAALDPEDIREYVDLYGVDE